VFHDSNVPLQPEPSGDAFAERVRGSIGTRKSFGELISARLEYTWFRKGPWESTVAYQFFQTINNDIPKLNIENHVGAVGATYRDAFRDMPYQAGLSFVYDYITLDNDEFLQRKTATLFGTLVENDRHLTTGQFRYQNKEFSNDSNIFLSEVRDGSNYMLGFVHVFRFAQDRHFLKAGYQFDLEDTEGGRNFDYNGHRLIVGGQYTYKWDEYVTRLRYDYDVHFRIYKHVHTLLPESAPFTKKRDDIEQTHAFRLEQPLTPSWLLAFDYQIIIARSNLPVFALNRNVATLSMSWLYDR
jgi:hypothetical protein